MAGSMLSSHWLNGGINAIFAWDITWKGSKGQMYFGLVILAAQN